jgi:hypothetical protein
MRDLPKFDTPEECAEWVARNMVRADVIISKEGVVDGAKPGGLPTDEIIKEARNYLDASAQYLELHGNTKPDGTPVDGRRHEEERRIN